MKLGPAFKVDRNLSRTISIIDLLVVAVAAFLVFPILLAGFGAVMLLSADTFNADRSHPMRSIGEFIVGMGYTGLYAWVGAPIAVAFGWFASRQGWIGWATAPIGGALGGVVFSLFFFGLEGRLGSGFLPFTSMFILLGATYAVAGWLALRWLMPDCFMNE